MKFQNGTMLENFKEEEEEGMHLAAETGSYKRNADVS
jgi:hypothetical protein